MNISEFRSSVNSALEVWHAEHFPHLDLFYENAEGADEKKVSSPWIDTSVRWYGGRQVSVGGGAVERYHGIVSVAIYCRAGTGTELSDQVMDSLTTALSRRRLGAATISTPTPYTPVTTLGWHKVGLMFPFKFDR